MSKKTFLLIFLFCFSLFTFSIQVNDTITVEKDIDWGNGILHLTITKQVNTQNKPSPDSKYLVEREIKDQLPDILLNSILDIHIDSAHSINDIILEKREGIHLLKGYYLSGKNEGAFQSQDLKRIYIHYSFPFFSDKGLIPLFIHHDYPLSPKREIGFIPTREYTGLIIYAKGLYLSYGTNREVYVEPSLFPVLYDEETNVVLDKWMCDPGYLKKWGMVAYSETANEEQFLKRTGLFPLKTMASQVFGKYHSDLILPRGAIRKLLSTEKNRTMLQQGRILIIIGPEGGGRNSRD